jgi:hypothetical protein
MTSKNTNCLYGWRCPACGSIGPFHVDFVAHGTCWLYDDGSDDEKRYITDFPDTGYTRCQCGHEDHTKNFQSK